MKRILLIQTAFIGDAILATALLEKLHFNFPTTEIDFLVRKGNESLFIGHPFLNKVLIWDKKNKYSSLWENLKQIRENKYDKAINLQRFGATGLLTALSGARQKIGFDKNPFSFLFNKKIEHIIGDHTHEIERNTKLISWFTDDNIFKPKLYPIIPKDSKTPFPYVTIAPTSVWFTKQFPESRWIELMKVLSKNYKIYLLGAKSDAEVCERMIGEVMKENAFLASHLINLAGKVSLLESAALMQNAKMNYVNDSAPMHLCSAVNAPVTAIFCSTIPAFGFGPLSDVSIIVEIKEKLGCRPCGLHGKKACPEGHFKCGFGIEITDFTSF